MNPWHVVPWSHAQQHAPRVHGAAEQSVTPGNVKNKSQPRSLQSTPHDMSGSPHCGSGSPPHDVQQHTNDAVGAGVGTDVAPTHWNVVHVSFDECDE